MKHTKFLHHSRWFSITLAGLLAASSCTAQDNGDEGGTGNANNNSLAIEVSSTADSAWSAEEFINAVSKPLPLAKGTVAAMKARGLQAQSTAAPVVSVAGSEGDGSQGGQTTLFNPANLPAPTLGATPTAAGSRGAYFSSSRLIPTSARVTYPYRTVGKIFFKDQAGGSFICSGAVIALRLVATAGHCVHSGSNGSDGYYRDIVFVPGYHSEGNQAPYGTWPATWVTTTPAWATSNGVVPNSADFAIFEVADQEVDGEMKSIGQRVGWLGYKSGSLARNHVKILGYPGSFDNGQIMHQVDSGDPAVADSNTVLYGSDMTGGSSGGPWVQNFGVKAVGQPNAVDDEMNRIVGITSYGFIDTEPKVQGSSVLNADFTAIYRAGCDRDPGNCR